MSERPITDIDLPALFRDADRVAVCGQERFLRATGARLLLALGAAACATLGYLLKVGTVQILSIVAATAFAAAFVIEIWLLSERPERNWYEGRAVAESAKTLTWRYAVAGSPFPLIQENADAYFAEQLAELLNDVETTSIFPNTEPVVSAAVSELRSRSLSRRRECYIRDRIVEQQRWYAVKAHYHARRASRWRLTLVVLELLGVIVAALKAVDVIHIDLTSIVSTFLGAGVAWLGVKQHESIARAYALASHELGVIAARLETIADETSWAAEVADAEEAISREHTLWRAARAVHEPATPRRSPTSTSPRRRL